MCPRRPRRYPAVLVAGAALVIAGCSDGGEAAPTTSAVSTTSTASASTEAPPSTTTTTTTTVAAGTIASSSVAPTAPSTDSSTSQPRSSTATSDPGAAAYDWTAIVTDLLRQEFELPRNPSLEGIDALCAEVSSCRETWTTTVNYLLENEVRLEGGAPFEVNSIEYQGTTDDVPIDEALSVVLILRQTVTEQGMTRLVRDDGSTFSEVPPDESLVAGEQISRTLVLGRDRATDGWRIVLIGDTV